jgi:transposase
MLRHRHKLVRFRTSVMNQLHGLAMGQGLCRKKKLWAKAGRKELQGLVLDPWASLRRKELLQLIDQLDPWIAKLDEAVIQTAESRPPAVCLMRQAGVGPVTALAFVLTMGPVSHFANSKNVVSYLGLNPSEESSGGRQRLQDGRNVLGDGRTVRSRNAIWQNLRGRLLFFILRLQLVRTNLCVRIL